MEHISELRESLNGYFGWNKARMTCFVKMLLALSQGLAIDIDALFYGLKPQEQRIIQGKRKIMGRELYLAGLRLTDGDLLIVATSEIPNR